MSTLFLFTLVPNVLKKSSGLFAPACACQQFCYQELEAIAQKAIDLRNRVWSIL